MYICRDCGRIFEEPKRIVERTVALAAAGHIQRRSDAVAVASTSSDSLSNCATANTTVPIAIKNMIS